VLLGLMSRTGGSTLDVTPDQSEVLAISDTVAVTARGQTVHSGEPREVCGRPVNHAVANCLGSTNILQGRVIEAHDDLATDALDGDACMIDVPSRSVLPLRASLDGVPQEAGPARPARH